VTDRPLINNPDFGAYIGASPQKRSPNAHNNVRRPTKGKRKQANKLIRKLRFISSGNVICYREVLRVTAFRRGAD